MEKLILIAPYLFLGSLLILFLMMIYFAISRYLITSKEINDSKTNSPKIIGLPLEHKQRIARTFKHLRADLEQLEEQVLAK